MISRFEQFSGMISGMYRCIQKIEQTEMEKYGLKGSYAQYLVVLRRYAEGLTAAQLSEICDRDKAAVSRAVTEMEARGLTCRTATGDNRYRAAIRLTEAGSEAAQYVCERAKIAVEMAGEGLKDADRTVFYAVLEQIASNLQKISKEGIPEL